MSEEEARMPYEMPFYTHLKTPIKKLLIITFKK
jgi:hypothetical protein